MQGQNWDGVNATRVTRSGAPSSGRLLELVRARGGLSRRQLLAETGMSRGTLFGRLDALARLGYVYEAESLGATGGRRPRGIRFDDRGRVVLAVDLGQVHARVGVTDLAGTELRHVSLPWDIADAPPAVFSDVLDRADALLADGSGEQLVGVGVGVPAAIDPTTGLVRHRTTLPGWPADTVVAAIRARWAGPGVVENDARAAAVGECGDIGDGDTGDGETLVYVKIATGLGCGIVVDGDVLRGARGIAGDIGHVRVPPPAGAGPAPRCRCGRTGCLAAYSSGRALLDRLAPARSGPGRRTGPDTLAGIVAAAGAGDPAVLAELAAAADVLGAALATTVITVNPHRLVLGGTLGALPVVVDAVRDRVRATVDERAWPEVTGSALGEVATIRGLARLVVRRAYAPATVDAAVAAAAAPGPGLRRAGATRGR